MFIYFRGILTTLKYCKYACGIVIGEGPESQCGFSQNRALCALRNLMEKYRKKKESSLCSLFGLQKVFDCQPHTDF